MARLSASIPSPPRPEAKRTHLVVPHQGEPIAPAHRGETFAMRPCLFRMSPRPRAQGRDIGRPTQPTAYGPSPCARGRDATNNQAGRQPAPRPRAQGRDYIDLGRFVRPPPRPCARGRDVGGEAHLREPQPLAPVRGGETRRVVWQVGPHRPLAPVRGGETADGPAPGCGPSPLCAGARRRKPIRDPWFQTPRPCARGRDEILPSHLQRSLPSPLCAGARPWENTEKRRGGHVVRCWPLRPSGRPA